MDWQAIGAIGQCASAIATVGAVVVALRPYWRRARLLYLPALISKNDSTMPGMRIIIRNMGSTYIYLSNAYFSIGRVPIFVSKPATISFPIKLEPGSQVEAAYSYEEIVRAIGKWTDRDRALIFHYIDAMGERHSIKISDSALKWANNQEILIKEMTSASLEK